MSKQNFGSKKIFGFEKKSEKILDPKKFWLRKNFGSEKILGSKIFVVVLVLLVTWTRGPLTHSTQPKAFK